MYFCSTSCNGRQYFLSYIEMWPYDAHFLEIRNHLLSGCLSTTNGYVLRSIGVDISYQRGEGGTAIRSRSGMDDIRT